MQAQANTGLGGDVNILEAMEMFKSVPDQVLPKYAQDPKLAIFAAAEMARRDDMRKRYNQRAQKPNKPVVAQLAESMAPSMPMMPPGMNAPQEPQPMQMAPSQMSQPQMQPEMQLKMQPPMQQQMQAGLGAVAPQGMAGGGMVSFKDGGAIRFNGGLQVPGVSQEFGGPGESVLSEAELEEVRRRAAQSGFVPQLVGKVGLSEVKDIREGRLTPEEIAVKTAIKTGQPLPPRQGAAQQQRQPVIQPQAAQQGVAPSMGIDAILKQGQMLRDKLGIQPTQVAEPYETANRMEQIYKERQERFPDKISPIMDQLKQFYGQQASKQDIDKAANRQIALAMMGSKDRNFLAGLAGGLQAGEDVKKTMGAENRAMQQASLQAQLAHARYQDAVRRGDYDAAQKAAREEQTINLRIQEMRRQDAMLPLELGIAAARAMPKPAAGQKPMSEKDRIELQMKVQALAEPKLTQLKTQWEKKWFKPDNWEQSPEYQNQQKAIIREVYMRNAPQLISPEIISDEEMRKRGG